MKRADEESRAGCWVRLEVAFLVHHVAKSAPKIRVSNTAKAPKNAFFLNTALQDGSERNKDREANPAGSQMACRPVVFCEPQQSTGRWEGGLEAAL